jgi:NADPH:quinone reductase-like Zn-dependent oxidoreductase
MRQIWTLRHGSEEVLGIRDAPDPRPGDGEVVVSTRAIGICFADIMGRMGLYPDAPRPPFVAGYEACGVVESTGPGVSGLGPGSPVIAMTRFGGYSTRVRVPAAQCWPLPQSMSFSEGAAVPVNSITAWLALFHMGGLEAGHSVLVRSAGGGVGTVALQMAHASGAAVIAAASQGKHERLSRMGASHCLSPEDPGFVREVLKATGDRGVDLCLNPVGGRSLRQDGRLLAPLGRIVAYGVSSLAPGLKRRIPAALSALLRTPVYHPFALMNRNRGILGLNVGHLWNELPALRRVIEGAMAMYADGKIRPVVSAEFAFDEVRAAHRYIQERKNFGKVVLLVNG